MSGRVLFLTKYGLLGASSRYRVYQNLPYLTRLGWSCEVRPLLDDEYVRRIYRARTPRDRAGIAIARIQAISKRLGFLRHGMSDFDVVYVEYEALPFVPFSIEKALLERSMRLVVDYDDALYVRYRRHPLRAVRTLLGDKLEHLIAMADCAIVANRTLAVWAAQRARFVRLVPTSIDLARYPSRRMRKNGTDIPIVAWIGTPVTVRYLETIAGALQKLQARHPFRLRVIGARRVAVPGVPVETVEWSEETEVEALQGCDIGIMPLPDDEWTRGKSALKLLQYMAAGLPSVVSAVGTSFEVAQEGVNGFLAASEEDWIEKLGALLVNPALRERVAEAALDTVRARYSLSANVGPWLEAVTGNDGMGEIRRAGDE